MIRNALISSLVVIFIFTFSNCAAIFKGTTDTVIFDSGPERAEVWINESYRGTTPLKLELKSKEEYDIEFRMEGYETRSYHIDNNVGVGWIILDILGGLVPIIIDAATGAWYSLDQKNINAVLQKQQ